MDKYKMLEEMIVMLDRLADARGVERCSLIVELVSRASALKRGLEKEDEDHASAIDALKTQLARARGEITEV